MRISIIIKKTGIVILLYIFFYVLFQHNILAEYGTTIGYIIYDLTCVLGCIILYFQVKKMITQNRKRTKKIIFKLIWLVIIAVIAYFSLIIIHFQLFKQYNYISSDSGFEDFEMPSKGRDLKTVELDFERYKKETGKYNIELYRTFKMELHRAGKYFEYIAHRRWTYKYVSNDFINRK